jgi:hypothetical protein
MLDIASQSAAAQSSGSQAVASQTAASQRVASQAVATPSRPKGYSLKSLASPVIMRQLDALAAQEHCTDAEALAHIAELDAREHYLSQGYSSMHDYCVRRLRMSEDRALKRIRVGRVALEFPAIFPMIADGRLNLSAVLLLKPRLTPENAAELLSAAALKSNAEVERLLAMRFPTAQMAGPALALDSGIAGEFEVEVAARPPLVPSSAANDASPMGPVGGAVSTTSPASRAALYVKFTPVSADCVAVRGQLSMAAYEQLRHLQALLGHRIPSGNAALVIEHALKLAVDLLEKRKFAKGVCTRPRDGKPNGRYVPAKVRQAVCERDGSRCTFTGPDGTRCGAETRLEFDHIVTFAEGGATTVPNLRLLCQKHNQYEAKRVFGPDFIRGRQERAKAAAVRQRMRRQEQADTQVLREHHGRVQAAERHDQVRIQSRPGARVAAEAAADPTMAEAVTPHRDDPPLLDKAAVDREAARQARHDDIYAGLRGLGFRVDEARRGAEWVNAMPEASLEQCMAAALKDLTRGIAQRGERMARCTA